MLSKQVKERQAQRRISRRIPKKRQMLLRLREMQLNLLKIARNGQFGAHFKPVDQLTAEEKAVEIKVLQKNLQEVRALKARAEAEDRVYFNGWRRGHK